MSKLLAETTSRTQTVSEKLDELIGIVHGILDHVEYTQGYLENCPRCERVEPPTDGVHIRLDYLIGIAREIRDTAYAVRNSVHVD